MKYYIDSNNEVFGFDSDGSQDAYIRPGMTPITQEQADALRAPAPSARIALAHGRINSAYEAELRALTADYPQSEIDSWPRQEQEAREKLADPEARVLWIKAASTTRRISVDNLAALIIQKADEFAPVHGAMTGKRQRLRDQINALGESPTQAQLDAIVW